MTNVVKKIKQTEQVGVLPHDYYGQNVLADPSHKIQLFWEYVYNLKKTGLKFSLLSHCHEARMKKNYLRKQE